MDRGAPATPPTQEVFAPAKLTLRLRVTGVRADGFHLIDAEMIALDFGDTLTITEANSTSITIDHAGDDPIPLGPDNLVARALALVGRTAAVHIRKQIPPRAGLGGGSADAAAILRWAGYRDLLAASTLGADVSFCVAGGRARVTGIGEIVEPLELHEQPLTLLTPPFGCSTPAVYRAWDELGGPEGDNGNDLEPAALVVEPRMAEWRDRLGDATGEQPRLAGSGSTWFVEGHHPDVAGAVLTSARCR